MDDNLYKDVKRRMYVMIKEVVAAWDGSGAWPEERIREVREFFISQGHEVGKIDELYAENLGVIVAEYGNMFSI